MNWEERDRPEVIYDAAWQEILFASGRCSVCEAVLITGLNLEEMLVEGERQYVCASCVLNTLEGWDRG